MHAFVIILGQLRQNFLFVQNPKCNSFSVSHVREATQTLPKNITTICPSTKSDWK